jgi:hypothetical protein
MMRCRWRQLRDRSGLDAFDAAEFAGFFSASCSSGFCGGVDSGPVFSSGPSGPVALEPTRALDQARCGLWLECGLWRGALANQSDSRTAIDRDCATPINSRKPGTSRKGDARHIAVPFFVQIAASGDKNTVTKPTGNRFQFVRQIIDWCP